MCIEHQKEILAELKRIKEDSELLPSMFRNQAGEQAKLIADKNEALALKKEYEAVYEQNKQEIKNL